MTTAKRRSGTRGPDLTYSERNRDGGCSILLRLSADDARMLDELRAVRGEGRSAAIRWAIRDAWEATQTPAKTLATGRRTAAR